MSIKPEGDKEHDVPLHVNSLHEESTKLLESESASYAKTLHDDMYIYGAYGFFDGLNLALTIPKLIFDQSYISSSDAAEALHDWMISPLGIAIMVIETVTLVSFSMFGCMFDDEDKNPFKSYTAFFWPYIRDMLKALKWAYKGVRNVFVALFRLVGADIRYLIMPLAIVLGVLSVLNRWWQRWMKAERKDMMKANAMLHQEVIAKGNNLHILSELPASTDQTYVNSYVFVKSRDEQSQEKRVLVYIDAEGQSKPVKVDDLKLFDDSLNQVLLVNLQGVMELKLGKNKPLRFLSKLDKALPKSYFNAYVYLTNDTSTQEKLFYIDATGQHQSVDKAIRDKFEDDLLAAKRNINLIGPTGEQVDHLMRVRGGQTESKLGLELDEWARYRKQVELKLEKEGRQTGSLPFRCYLAAVYSGFVDGIYFYMGALILCFFVPPLFIAMAIFSTIVAFMYIVSKIYEEYDFQRKLWATETRVKLALCVKELDILVTELTKTSELVAYSDRSQKQESTDGNKGCELHLQPFPTLDQRVNYINKYVCNGTELGYINEEQKLTKLTLPDPQTFLADINKLKITPDDTKIQLTTEHIRASILPMLKEHQEVLWGRLTVLLKEREACEKELQSQVLYTYGLAALEGLKNGLAVQGVLASAMFATATVLLILSVPCPPIFVITCAIAGIGCLIAMIAHALIVHHASLAQTKADNPDPNSSLNAFLADLKINKRAGLTAEANDITKARTAIYTQVVEPAPQFFIFEWCEIFRYLFSGAVKGEKTVGEITGKQLNELHDSPITLIISAICALGSAIVVGVVFALRALAKWFGRAPVDSVATKSSLDIKPTPVVPLNKPTPPPQTTCLQPEPEVKPTQEVKTSSTPEKGRVSVNGVFKPELGSGKRRSWPVSSMQSNISDSQLSTFSSKSLQNSPKTTLTPPISSTPSPLTL
ncbi:hypothetical protein N9Q05_00385 [bacterium]|nr:hypothetical protein [bacterium]